MKTLGILGGMGSEATIDLFNKVVKCEKNITRDQDRIHIIIDNYSQIPDRTSYILGNGENPLPYLLKSAKLLEKSGVDSIIMPCNTAHYFLPDLQSQISVPFVSIIESTVDEIVRLYPNAKTIVPISTTGTKKAGLYDQALINKGYTVPNLTEDMQERIMYCIYEGIKKGNIESVVNQFQDIISEINSVYRPDVLIAACTEIPLFIPYLKQEYNFIDATLSLAEAAYNYCTKTMKLD